jgi:hypothetical protein
VLSKSSVIAKICYFLAAFVCTWAVVFATMALHLSLFAALRCSTW